MDIEYDTVWAPQLGRLWEECLETMGKAEGRAEQNLGVRQLRHGKAPTVGQSWLDDTRGSLMEV